MLYYILICYIQKWVAMVTISAAFWGSSAAVKRENSAAVKGEGPLVFEIPDVAVQHFVSYIILTARISGV